MKSWQRPNFVLISRMIMVLIGIMALDLFFVWFIHHQLHWPWWFEIGVGFILALVMLVGGWVLSPRLFMASAEPLGPKWQERLERIAFLADIPVPVLFQISSPVANAFTVRSWTGKGYAIVVTDTLLRDLQPDEFDAVIAHEVAHIAHHDMTMILVAGSLNLVLNALMQRWWILGNLLSFRQSNNNPVGIVMAGITLTWAVSTLLTRLFSRYRELAADETASVLLGSPVGLIKALENCEAINRHYVTTQLVRSGHKKRPVLPKDLRTVEAAQLLGFIWTGVSKWSALASHPSTDERIARLHRYWN
ncbi:M48 family metalloprotease [Sulfobacillus thermosulfidooxidans]|uniref:M48 family metalloprotease n=1 Tax=Sulfobacillus thermosulfidooxidans TaxID=28034 RepID=UPI0006B62603|nr:M48 family metalloprotease [Sulfobacillus thermosulfidooxidans]